jgi:hypothetical protein
MLLFALAGSVSWAEISQAPVKLKHGQKIKKQVPWFGQRSLSVPKHLHSKS